MVNPPLAPHPPPRALAITVTIAVTLAFLPLLASYLIGASWTLAILGQQQGPLMAFLIAAGAFSLVAFVTAWRSYYFTAQPRLPLWAWIGLTTGIVHAGLWTYLMKASPLWMAMFAIPGLIALDHINRWRLRQR